jgi:hypothetical protein
MQLEQSVIYCSCCEGTTGKLKGFGKWYIVKAMRNSGHCSLSQAEYLTTLQRLDLLPLSDEARKGKRLL